MSQQTKYTPEELQEAIEAYFEHTEYPTITGLCYTLGFASRQSFYDYEKRDAFSYTIKKARLRMESVYEELLHKNSPTGAIFALKNFGWTDKQQIDHTSGGERITDVNIHLKVRDE